MKIESSLLKLYTIIVNNGRDEIVQGIIDELGTAQVELLDISYLLKVVRKAIKVLERRDCAYCNLQLSELIQFLYQRELIIIDNLDQYITKSKLATKGIQYMGTNKNQVALEDVDENIDASVKALGLFKENVQ